MKKIGILFGQENTFPQAFVDRVNEKLKADNEKGIVAEFVALDQVIQGVPSDYAVIIDRISQDVPFYRSFLKNAAIGGTSVINNPFWWSADEKFFNNALAVSIGVPVPKTVLLPSFQHPTDTNHNSFRNLKLDWEKMMNEPGFPAYMKPHAGGGWKSVYKLNSIEDFYRNHPETAQLVMMLQESVDFTDYFRCYCIDRQDVKIMPYEPRNPHHLRYVAEGGGPEQQKLLETIREYVLKLNRALGYDFNTVEFAVRDGIPYAIDFCNPAPDADVHSVGQANFDWVVEAAANMAIRRAKSHKDGVMNLTWGEFVRQSVNGLPIAAPSIESSNGKKAKNGKSEKAEAELETVGEEGTKKKASKKSSKKGE